MVVTQWFHSLFRSPDSRDEIIIFVKIRRPRGLGLGMLRVFGVPPVSTRESIIQRHRPFAAQRFESNANRSIDCSVSNLATN